MDSDKGTLVNVTPEMAKQMLALNPDAELAEAFTKSEEIQPYIKLMVAQSRGDEQQQKELWQWLKDLPFEKRYIHRVMAGLTIAFCDYDSATAEIDRKLITPEHCSQIREELEARAKQLRYLLKVFA